MTAADAARKAEFTIELLKHRMEEAVRYAEAYNHDGRTVVIDGSQYSPSTRALPGAESVYARSYDTPAIWHMFETTVNDFIEQHGIEDDSSDVSLGSWSFGWDDGILFAFFPDIPGEC